MLLTLCIPTNGIVDWVIPVLDSIYSQSVDENLFEVVVADNGESAELEKKIQSDYSQYSNLKYSKTSANGFENQIMAFSMASGEFIKFINHRMLVKPGTIMFLIDYIRKNLDNKPLTYFSNGKLSFDEKEYNSFDMFLSDLLYWSSWSAGVSVWRTDLELIKNEKLKDINTLFPHMVFIVLNKKEKYVINNEVLLEEIETDYTKRAKYNLFYAFSVEYISIILDLVRHDIIKMSTFTSVVKSMRFYCAKLYVDFIVLKKKCSFDLTDYKDYIEVFFSKKGFYFDCIKVFWGKIKRYLTRQSKGAKT